MRLREDGGPGPQPATHGHGTQEQGQEQGQRQGQGQGQGKGVKVEGNMLRYLETEDMEGTEIEAVPRVTVSK